LSNSKETFSIGSMHVAKGESYYRASAAVIQKIKELNYNINKYLYSTKGIQAYTGLAEESVVAIAAMRLLGGATKFASEKVSDYLTAGLGLSKSDGLNASRGGVAITGAYSPNLLWKTTGITYDAQAEIWDRNLSKEYSVGDVKFRIDS
jgi:hypothetical protein